MDIWENLCRFRYWEEVFTGLSCLGTIISLATHSKADATARMLEVGTFSKKFTIFFISRNILFQFPNFQAAPVLSAGTDDFTKFFAQQPPSNSPTVLLSGRINTLDPTTKTLSSSDSSMPAVIVRHQAREILWRDPFDWKTFDLGLRIGPDESLPPSLTYIPFLLTNPNCIPSPTSTNSTSCSNALFVDNLNNATLWDSMVTSRSIHTPSPFTFTSLIFTILGGAHSRGQQTIEEVLPLGDVVSVIGNISKLEAKEGPAVARMVGRYVLTSRTPSEIQQHFRDKANVSKLLVILSGGLLVFSLVFLGLKIWKNFRVKRGLASVRLQRRGTQGLSHDQICVTCLENRREIAFVPCGHVCVCADCCTRIQGRCPVCRAGISNMQPLFYA